MSGHYTGTQIGLSELIGSFRSNLKFSAEIGQKKWKKFFFFWTKIGSQTIYILRCSSKFLDRNKKIFMTKLGNDPPTKQGA